MARLGQQQLQLLKNAFIKRSPKVKLTANWRAIYRELEVGELDESEKYLCFAPKDFDLLRQGVLALMGLDLRQLDFNVDRMAMSAKSHNEKLAKIRPEAEYVLMKYLGFESSPTGISTRTSLRIPLDEGQKHCREFDVSAILVVENLDVFDVIHQARLPEDLTNVMVIYRGSGHHSPIGVRHFLQAMADELPIIAFTDLDPAGLQIAHTLTGVTYWLVPQLALTAPAELLAMTQINSTYDFDKQAKQAKYLQHADLKHWQKLAFWLTQHRISIKQQHLLAHGLELVLVPYI
ncbi:DUF7281 domain-containing protein [Shewanella sp. HN-41]|uniref:DUF7281 domain-containing protein n=1 Tax=Shewanella sp. HN-41 TaxID=327275 RepID=UPI0002125C33|nr:hypothetical protein [Shewanella sp. HN-41]EGM71661.1 hypothetical protein SOHN41_00262 [Shewanella sp. HN-41]